MNQLLKVTIVILAFTGAGFLQRTVQSQTCTAPPSGLVAWWPGDNNALDYQGDSNGTLQNGAAFAPGMVAQAFSFDGVDDQILVPHNANQNTGSQITIDAWVNPSSAGSGRPILQKRSSSNLGGYTFETPGGSDNALFWGIWIGGTLHSIQTSANVLTIGTFQHVAATYDGAVMKIYVNGIEQASMAQTGAIDAVTDPVVIGRNVPIPSFAWQGLIDEIQVFNRGLTQSEIQAIFNAGSAGQCKPPLFIQPIALPDGIVSSPYSQIITAGAGTGPYTFTISNGSLPPGLNLSNGGTISGTPQATGTFNFTVQATDSNNVTAQRAYSMSIVPGCIAPPSNMVGWYPGDGNAVDIQSGNNGSLQGGATFAPGKVGQAFSLNGSSAYVQAAAISAQDPTTAGSLDAWVYLNQLPSQVGHAMAIIVKGGNGTDFNLQVFNNGGDRFFLQVAANTNVPSTTIVQTGQWYHVAGTWDSTVGLRIYVNGVLENTNSALVTRGQSGQPFTIGNDPVFGPRLFNGLIDEAQIFDRALTASEVQAIFNAGIAGQCKSPSPNFCGVISGKITDAQGALSGALVQACEPNNGPCSFNATTDAGGNYQITGLPVSTPFDLTIFPPQGSVDVPGELLGRSVSACGTPLSGQDALLQPPALPASGTSIQPNRNGGGGAPAVYWQSPLTLTTSGCASGTASYIISRGFSNFASGSMTETPAGSGTYTASVPQLFPGHGAASVSMTVQCSGGGSSTTAFNIYIDPSGTVKTSSGAPVSGATVTLFRSDTANGPFTIVPDGDAVMSPGNRHNPDVTDAAGQFGWDVLSGFYKVRAQSDGCTDPVDTGVLQIPPPVTDLVLTLTCPTQLTTAGSPKMHGNLGPFTVDLPLTGQPGVECRYGGAGGNHTLVFTFNNNVQSGNASVTKGTVGSIGAPTFAGKTMSVDLGGVDDGQTITVSLSGVTDRFSQAVPDTAVSVGVLAGDTNGDGRVNIGDVLQTRSRSGQILDQNSGNFRSDVTLDGRINVGDGNFVKAHSGDFLP